MQEVLKSAKEHLVEQAAQFQLELDGNPEIAQQAIYITEFGKQILARIDRGALIQPSAPAFTPKARAGLDLATDPVDAAAYTFAENFGLLGEPSCPSSDQALWEATFENPGTGLSAFERLKRLLEEKHLIGSVSALSVMEEEMRQILSEKVAIHSSENTVVLHAKNILYAVLFIMGGLLDDESRDKVQFLMRANFQKRLLLTAGVKGEREISVTNNFFGSVLLALSDDSHKRALLDLQQLYLKMKELRPLFEAFRMVLLSELLEQNDPYCNARFSPLVSPDGFKRAMSVAKDGNDYIQTFFALLPTAVKKHLLRDLVPAPETIEEGKVSPSTGSRNILEFSHSHIFWTTVTEHTEPRGTVAWTYSLPNTSPTRTYKRTYIEMKKTRLKLKHRGKRIVLKAKGYERSNNRYVSKEINLGSAHEYCVVPEKENFVRNDTTQSYWCGSVIQSDGMHLNASKFHLGWEEDIHGEGGFFFQSDGPIELWKAPVSEWFVQGANQNAQVVVKLGKNTYYLHGDKPVDLF